MAKMMVFGNELIEESDFEIKKDKLANIEIASDSHNLIDSGVLLADGRISSEVPGNERNPIELINGNREVPYRPIGIGKPLSIEILTVYTGEFLRGLAIGNKRDLLLCTAIKTSSTHDAQANALNLLRTNQQERQYLDFSATEGGTRIIFYSPSVEVDSYEISFSFIADTFNNELVQTVASAFSKAASFPVFLPAAAYLLAGSEILKIAGSTGNTLLQKKPFLSDNIRLNFEIGGLTNSISRKLVIFNEDHHREFDEYIAETVEVLGQTSYKLINRRSREPYNGSAPYLIINIDGGKRESLKTFTPKLATAAVLQKFGEERNGGSNFIAEKLEQAMSLYNDSSYAKKASSKKAELDNLTEGTEEYINTKQLYDAYIKNISNDIFKPKPL